MRTFFLVGLFSLVVSLVSGREFSVVVYNIENLFDMDGVAIYDDYQPDRYTPAHLSTKLTNTARIMALVNDGRGPDIILFNEIELDQTPETGAADPAAWIAAIEGKRYDELLAQDPLPPELAGLSSATWLLKALHDHGMTGYTLIETDEQPGTYEGGRGIAITNIILSRFPVEEVRSHHTQNARAILEARVSVDGHPFYLFNNHWKSGAGNPVTEVDRRASARTLRQRLNEILAEDPNADILIGGDLNSHYNQKWRYREMRETGINDVLGSQGNVLAIRGSQRDLYNLWFELPSNQRGSDVFRGEWGTLMHIILSRGLYDYRGVQYIDRSFTVMKIEGMNADAFGQPLRWNPEPAPGRGFSDHFPLLARFRVVDDNRPDRWLALRSPSTEDTPSGEARRVDFASVNVLRNAVRIDDLAAETNLRDGSLSGRIFRLVDVPAHVNERGHVQVTVRDEVYDVFSHNADLRNLMRDQARREGRLTIYGELGTFRGNWQFVVHGREWIQ